MPRVFIAVHLVPDLRAAVLRVQDHLRDGDAALRWVSSENLHFTLRFLGEISPAQVERATAAARETAEVSPFSIRLAGVGAFPTPARPRVVWIGVSEGNAELRALAERLEHRLRLQRFPKADKPFAPHLTVARVREGRDVGGLARAIYTLGGLEVGTQMVDAMAVMESQLHPHGAIYTVLEHVPLGAPR